MKFLLFLFLALSTVYLSAQDIVKKIILDDKGNLIDYKLNSEGYLEFDFGNDGLGSLNGATKYFYNTADFNIDYIETNVQLYVNIKKGRNENIINFKDIIQRKESFFIQKQPNTDFVYAITDSKGIFKRFNFNCLPIPFDTKPGYSTIVNFTTLNENSYSTVFEFLGNSELFKKKVPYLYKLNIKTGDYKLRELKFLKKGNTYSELLNVNDNVYTYATKSEINAREVRTNIYTYDTNYKLKDSIVLIDTVSREGFKFFDTSSFLERVKKKDRKDLFYSAYRQSGKIEFNKSDGSYYSYGKIFKNLSEYGYGRYLTKFDGQGNLVWKEEFFFPNSKKNDLYDYYEISILNTDYNSLILVDSYPRGTNIFREVTVTNCEDGKEIINQIFTKDVKKRKFLELIKLL